MDQIGGRSQKNVTLFIHLEESTCCICISNQISRSYNFKVYVQGSVCQICMFRENFLYVIRFRLFTVLNISSARHHIRFISIVDLPDFFKSSA